MFVAPKKMCLIVDWFSFRTYLYFNALGIISQVFVNIFSEYLSRAPTEVGAVLKKKEEVLKLTDFCQASLTNFRLWSGQEIVAAIPRAKIFLCGLWSNQALLETGGYKRCRLGKYRNHQGNRNA